MVSLSYLISATKPDKWECKSFYKQPNNLPNVSYAIQQVKASIDLHHKGCKATNAQYQG